ncbi:MAG: ctaC [Planctomycetota bacterium]|nr:ctaC [Planctomycetota bacterium]
MWNFPLFPERASTGAHDVDFVFFCVMLVILFFLGLILSLFVTFLIRYRRGTKVNRSEPPDTNLKIEVAWVVIPLIISILLYVLATSVFFRLYRAPGDAYVVNVVGKRWMFTLQHPEGKREINELHVPIGRPVQLQMISQDVIHSFFVPAFRTKQDLLPGRYTTLWFEPTKVGKYHLFCAEYCGTNHSRMAGSVYVMEPADYERWLEVGGSNITLAKQGEALFQARHCGGCHGPSQAVRAPLLDGVYGSQVPVLREGDKVPHFVAADQRYIRDSILEPKKEIVAGYEPLMPSYRDQLGEDDLLKLIAYIKSIGLGKEAAR